MVSTSEITKAAPRPRDVRLDFFRGLCLVIIFIAHIWDNSWAQFIPARFGFSDAADIFVFCSGMASALAFGAVFTRHGLLVGTARVAFRCWQVYWAHIGTFLAAVTCMLALDATLRGDSYVEGLGLAPMFGAHAREALLGLTTLTFVPHYFDILPMYLVILCLLPAVMALALWRPVAAFAFVLLLWALSTARLVELPAEPWGSGVWFFNPFAWQLLFFTGFAFMSGWLPAPPIDRRLVWLSALVVAASVPLAWTGLWERYDILREAREALGLLIDKTHYGVLRFAHFLALAYLAYVAVGEGGRRLRGAGVEILRRLGQQSLAVFMSGLVLSVLASALLNATGRDPLPVALVNLGGIALLIALARAVAWFKSQPWRAPKAVAQEPVAAQAPAFLPPGQLRGA
jgi:hypothetical protein